MHIFSERFVHNPYVIYPDRLFIIIIIIIHRHLVTVNLTKRFYNTLGEQWKNNTSTVDTAL